MKLLLRIGLTYAAAAITAWFLTEFVRTHAFIHAINIVIWGSATHTILTMRSK